VSGLSWFVYNTKHTYSCGQVVHLAKAVLLRPVVVHVVQFPYYTFVDRSKMYSVGSLFYAIYFFVSFPMFMRIEEDPKDRKWSLGQVSIRGRCASGKDTSLRSSGTVSG